MDAASARASATAATARRTLNAAAYPVDSRVSAPAGRSAGRLTAMPPAARHPVSFGASRTLSRRTALYRTKSWKWRPMAGHGRGTEPSAGSAHLAADRGPHNSLTNRGLSSPFAPTIAPLTAGIRNRN